MAVSPVTMRSIRIIPVFKFGKQGLHSHKPNRIHAPKIEALFTWSRCFETFLNFHF